MNEQSKFPAGTAFTSIGQPLRRKEDARLLTGKGRFSDDFALDGQCYAAMVRSPHPHARIVRIDTAAAKAMPGVLAVLTGADCKAEGLKPIPHTAVPQTKFDMKTGQVVEFVDDEIEKLQALIAKRLGYKLVDHRLELYGVPLEEKG